MGFVAVNFVSTKQVIITIFLLIIIFQQFQLVHKMDASYTLFDMLLGMFLKFSVSVQMCHSVTCVTFYDRYCLQTRSFVEIKAQKAQ